MMKKLKAKKFKGRFVNGKLLINISKQCIEAFNN